MRKDQSVNLLTRRKEPWKQNPIRTNRANLPLPVSRAVAASRKIRTDRNVNANSASARSRLAEAKGVVVANKAALSKAGNHNPWINKRRESSPAVSLFPYLGTDQRRWFHGDFGFKRKRFLAIGRAYFSS